MSQLDKQENIDELRKRLYSRGDQFNQVERHNVSDITVDVSRDWTVPEPDEATTLNTKPAPRSRRYRWYILLSSFVVLLLTGLVTGYYMFSGGNQISSDNIEVSITAPNTLGGGEMLNAQITVTNENAVTIDAATLIVTYPENAQTATEPRESLFEKRIFIDRLTAGETRNVPVEAVVFGEEGDQRQLQAQLEYRIENSDSLFYKDAPTHNFRIISSPVTLQIDSVRQVSAGQEVEVEITVRANTNQEFNNLLVTARYPDGFTYTGATPNPDFNQNVWRIDSLAPEESATIRVKGSVVGLAEEELRLNVSVGPSLPNNQYIAGATLTEAFTDFVIERPFIDVAISINGRTQNPAVLQAGDAADMRIEVTNTLNEPVYDVAVEVVPTGSALTGAVITSNNGFYDSNTRTVRFDQSRVANFAELPAGESAVLNLTVDPDTQLGASSFSAAVNVYGRRVGEVGAQEQLFGTAEIEARYSSAVGLSHSVQHIGGPLPPVAGKETSYQVVLVAKAGSNEITNGELTASLPVYARWDENFQAEGNVQYNPVSRQITWQVGSMSGGQEKTLRFAATVTPSTSQVNRVPILLEQQTFTATDRFTGAELSAINPSFTIEIGDSNETEEGTGVVQEE